MSEQKLEEVSKKLETLEQVVRNFDTMFSFYQEALGIKLILEKDTNRLQVQMNVNKEGKNGFVTDLYLKMQKLWKKYGDNIIIVPR